MSTKKPRGYVRKGIGFGVGLDKRQARRARRQSGRYPLLVLDETALFTDVLESSTRNMLWLKSVES